MSTGCTIQIILPEDNPNEGRNKINQNFACVVTGNPTGFSGSFFTNPSATTTTVGGIAAGTTFPSQYTVQQMFDFLLYPFQAPTFSSFLMQGQDTVVEVGNSISGIKTFNWLTTQSINVEPNSLSISDTTNSTILGSSLENDGTENLDLGATIQKTTPSSHVWTISGTDTQSGGFSRNFTIEWRWRMFFGTSTNTTLNATQIQGLANSNLSTSIVGSYSLAAGGYKYFCVPNSFGNINTIVDGLTGFNIAMADASDGYTNVAGGFNYQIVSITNVNGQTTDYRVYRTKNILGSAINIIIN